MRQRWSRSPTQHGALTIVDAVTSLGGMPVHVDEWGIDAVYSGSQKCLSCTPGPVAGDASASAPSQRIKARTTPVQSWFLDLNLVLGYWRSQARAPTTTPRRSTRCTRCTKRW